MVARDKRVNNLCLFLVLLKLLNNSESMINAMPIVSEPTGMSIKIFCADSPNSVVPIRLAL